MGVLSMGIGETIKCMVRVCLHGQITGGMKVSISRIRSKAMVPFIGLMGVNT